MSKIVFSTAAAFVAFAVLAPMQASAQQRGNERVAPRGSFAQSCSGAYTNQGRLYADCQNMNGRTIGTSIELAPCSSSDISNDNGLLVCNDGRTRGVVERGNGNGGVVPPDRGTPRGSYLQSCSDASNRQGRLSAECRDVRGNRRSTSIDIAPCGTSDITNDNGLLVCNNGHTRGVFDRQDGNGGGWGNGGGGGNNGGGWGSGGDRSSITVYRDAEFRGPSTTFRDSVGDLSRSPFNDAISSMRFEGAWEACSNAYFRGDCQVFYGDVRDLRRSGLNDRISSLRPARGGGRR